MGFFWFCSWIVCLFGVISLFSECLQLNFFVSSAKVED